MKKLSTIMKELKVDKIDILKMDIEGSEYDVIKNILEEKIVVNQILVEFHHKFSAIGISRTKKSINLLNQHGYLIFSISKSGNEYSFIKHYN